MPAALVRRFSRRVQRESEEDEAANARERRQALGLRGHPPAEGLAAREQRKRRNEARGFVDRGAHRGLRERRCIRALRAALHVGKLIAQRGDAAPGEPGSDRGHEWMLHPGTCSVREHEARARIARRLQQTGHAAPAVDAQGDRLGAGTHPVVIESTLFG